MNRVRSRGVVLFQRGMDALVMNVRVLPIEINFSLIQFTVLRRSDN